MHAFINHSLEEYFFVYRSHLALYTIRDRMPSTEYPLEYKSRKQHGIRIIVWRSDTTICPAPERPEVRELTKQPSHLWRTRDESCLNQSSTIRNEILLRILPCSEFLIELRRPITSRVVYFVVDKYTYHFCNDCTSDRRVDRDLDVRRYLRLLLLHREQFFFLLQKISSYIFFFVDMQMRSTVDRLTHANTECCRPVFPTGRIIGDKNRSGFHDRI